MTERVSAPLAGRKPLVTLRKMTLGRSAHSAPSLEACTALSTPFTAAVSSLGEESRWTRPQEIYAKLLGNAARIEIVSETRYNNFVMQRRNEWMVDASDRLLALWDGSSGGTANCVRYARGRGKRIVKLWDDWEAWRSRVAE